MKPSAKLSEIFSSLQGEGPLSGERMTFVRFAGCGAGCRYCDTPAARSATREFRVESPPGSGSFVSFVNPVDVETLERLTAPFVDSTVSVTGGEPLEQADFLAAWLPSLSRRRRVLLETNGIEAEALARVVPFVHVVSMDMKLPSSCGGEARWGRHEEFLRAAISSGGETYVKMVVTAETTDLDLGQAISVISKTRKFLPVVIQPVTPTLSFSAPASPERVESIRRLLNAWLPDVRVIPQMHKVWGVL